MNFQLQYVPLERGRPSLVFLCDAQGNVELGQLDRDALNDYLFARAMVGLQYKRPEIQPWVSEPVAGEAKSTCCGESL